jgi:hypothetical protein
MRRPLIPLAMSLYCLAIFLVLDFVYSSYLHDQERSPRHFNSTYNHGLVPNFEGYEYWGDVRYKVYTNSLGFRDASIRKISNKPSFRRVMLMGDSFTEGEGVSFEDSFAGMLYSAGMQRANKIEFLNAGVAGYSPSAYYRKTKYFMEKGLRFDEVVVFSDISDVHDEATGFFCIDDDPSYRKYCDESQFAIYQLLCSRAGESNLQSCDEDGAIRFYRPTFETFLRQRFTITDKTRAIIKFRIQALLGNQKKRQLAGTEAAEWLFTDQSPNYPPLGIQGGIARSVEHMQALADLLRKNGIPLTIVVYPWPVELAAADRNSRQIALWKEFCARNCKGFINLFPSFFAAKDIHDDWYERYFIAGDYHYSPQGHRLMFGELAKNLL